jgi:phosphohistidine phosphatase
MKLYLVRHATAEEATDTKPDGQRSLTEDGIEKFKQAARGFARTLDDESLKLILTSPLVRARQTAEILAKALAKEGIKAPVRVHASLDFPGDLAKALDEARGAGGDVALVGHEPYLSEWIGRLCFLSVGAVEMKKGAIAVIEMAEAGTRGELLQLLPPRILRKL